MAKRRARDLTVGTIFALGLVILALGVMAVGGDSGLFFAKNSYRTVFSDATGLVVGAPVRMSGVQIGTVTDIRLPTDPREPGIQVGLAILPTYAERVRDDSRASLRILQLLTSEKFVEIFPGSPGSPPLDAGSLIPPLEELGVFERGEAVAESLSEITVSLKNILEPLERGEGLIGRMIQDPEFAQRGAEALSGTLDNLHAITGDLREGRGPIGRLLRDEELAAKLDSFSEGIDRFSATMAAIERREGVLGDLLNEDGAGRAAMNDLAEAAASARRIAKDLEQDRGLLGRLLNDPEYSEGLADDLERTIADLSAIADKLNSGDGTLGALLNERTLHDGAEDVIAGVDDSRFARWLLRHYRKKGVKASERESGD